MKHKKFKVGDQARIKIPLPRLLGVLKEPLSAESFIGKVVEITHVLEFDIEKEKQFCNNQEWLYCCILSHGLGYRAKCDGKIIESGVWHCCLEEIN